MNKTMACEDCEAIDEAFGKMGEMQKKIAIKKITEMEESLEKLEDELTDIINTHSNIFYEKKIKICLTGLLYFFYFAKPPFRALF